MWNLPKIPPGLYVVTYHDISWSENHFMRGMGAVTSPDLFRKHLLTYKALGKVVSLSEGLQQLKGGTLTRPCFVITFDDGFSGVLRHALPILRENDCPATLSVCPGFLLHQEFFWRIELNFIANAGRLHVLRHRLRQIGYQGGYVNSWIFKNLSGEVRACIHSVFIDNCPAYVVEDAWRLFLTPEECKRLVHDWQFTLLNHSFKHYSYFDFAPEVILEDFQSAHKELLKMFGSSYQGDLALPFSNSVNFDVNVLKSYLELSNGRVVFGNNNIVNWGNSTHQGYLNRITTDNLPVNKLNQRLHFSTAPR